MSIGIGWKVEKRRRTELEEQHELEFLEFPCHTYMSWTGSYRASNWNYQQAKTEHLQKRACSMAISTLLQTRKESHTLPHGFSRTEQEAALPPDSPSRARCWIPLPLCWWGWEVLSFFFGLVEVGSALIIQAKEYQQSVRACSKEIYSAYMRLHTLLMSAKPCGGVELLSQPCNNKVKCLMLGPLPFLVAARLKEKLSFIRANERWC